MMTISSEEESAGTLFFSSGLGMTPTPSSINAYQCKSTSLALAKPSTALTAASSDLELRLLEAFVGFAGQQLVGVYLNVKNASRVTQFLGNTTERLLTATGVAAIVRFLFAQYKNVGGPLLGYIDDAMGKRVIDAVVGILLLSNEQSEGDGSLSLEEGGPIKLSREERLQALLRGDVPRLKALLDASYRSGHDAALANASTPVVMELKDFVPIDELKELKEANREQVRELNQEMAALRSAMGELNKEKQRLEQRLIDVHNYCESERGHRFQDMEVRALVLFFLPGDPV
jgi:uncharacterized protein YhaN